MSQHDMKLANGPGATFRVDLNGALSALVSQSSGATAPSPAFPCQLWANTGTGRLKQRDSANTQWLDRGGLDTARAPFGGYTGITAVSTNTGLTATNLGQLVLVTAVGTTQTLPPLASSPAGASVTLAVFAATTIKGSGTELITNIYNTSSPNSMVLCAGEQTTLTSNGSGGVNWVTASYERAERPGWQCVQR